MTVAIAIPPLVIHCLVSTDAFRKEILSSTTHQVALACLLAAFGDRSTPIRGTSFVGKAGGGDRHEQSQCDEPEHLSLSMAATPLFYTTGRWRLVRLVLNLSIRPSYSGPHSCGYICSPDGRFGICFVTLLAALVVTSRELGANASRLAKVRALAAFLRTLDPDELETAVLYLAGETPQVRSGIGPALLQPASSGPATNEPTLQILETDRLLDEVAKVRGAGSQATRTTLLRGLFARSTALEREFLLRLLLGDLRQGALAGVMVDAIALDRKSTRLNSSHSQISYAVFCLKKKKKKI